MIDWRRKVSISVARTENPLDDALVHAGDHMVSHLERTLHEQDQARHEIRDDVLQTKTDAEREGTGDKCEAGKVDPGSGDADDRRKPGTEIADPHLHRIAHAAIDL